MDETEKPSNPPAFPFASDVLGHVEGMTLRDYFAGQAMQGMVANGGWIERMAKRTGNPADICAARAAYELADTMLLAREGNA